jgi:hypothetical protein
MPCERQRKFEDFSRIRMIWCRGVPALGNTPNSWRGVRATSFALAEHHQQHARWLKRFDGMWDVGGHPHDGSWDRPDGLSADRKSDGTFEHENERIERVCSLSSWPASNANSVRLPPSVLAKTRLAIPCSVVVIRA